MSKIQCDNRLPAVGDFNMYISYSGVIAPYLYNCPYAHFLRNVKRMKIEKKEEATEEVEVSKRTRGIELHESLSAYLKQEEDEFPFVTELITFFREHPFSEIEKPFYTTLDFEPLQEPNYEIDFYGIRPDAFVFYDNELHIADWKFANSEYNAARHYGEVEYFIALLSHVLRDVESVVSYIHFPEQNYTLPIRSYTTKDIAQLQQKQIQLVDKILSTKVFVPNPAKFRCSYCNYRSEDTGGAGFCEHTCI